MEAGKPCSRVPEKGKKRRVGSSSWNLSTPIRRIKLHWTPQKPCCVVVSVTVDNSNPKRDFCQTKKEPPGDFFLPQERNFPASGTEWLSKPYPSGRQNGIFSDFRAQQRTQSANKQPKKFPMGLTIAKKELLGRTARRSTNQPRFVQHSLTSKAPVHANRSS